MQAEKKRTDTKRKSIDNSEIQGNEPFTHDETM